MAVECWKVLGGTRSEGPEYMSCKFTLASVKWKEQHLPFRILVWMKESFECGSCM